MSKTMNAKEFLGEELYTIIENMLVKANESSKESNESLIKALREEAINLDSEKVSLVFNGIADRIESL